MLQMWAMKYFALGICCKGHILVTWQTIYAYTDSQIQDALIELYGFENYKEKHLFLVLQSVSGVGSKIAMSILDTYSDEKIET